jgi:hypothetical protein
MSQQLTELLRSVEVTAPQEANGLQVFGLRWAIPDGPLYQTLDEALAAEALDVTEVSEGGSVPTLRVVNKADVLVFLMAGEQLVGAKQNRVLNASLMVPARGEMPIPVSCVEAGRWGYRSPKFAGSGAMSHGHLRKMLCSHTSESYLAFGAPASKQGEVWGEIDRKLGAMKSASPTHALMKAYEDHDAHIGGLLASMQAPEGCCGVAFALHGKIAGIDLFDRPATLAKLWAKVFRAYALDVLEQTEAKAAPLTAEAVREWLATADRAKVQPFKSPGLGYDVRLDGTTLVGAGLVVEEHPVHVELFANEPPVLAP